MKHKLGFDTYHDINSYWIQHSNRHSNDFSETHLQQDQEKHPFLKLYPIPPGSLEGLQIFLYIFIEGLYTNSFKDGNYVIWEDLSGRENRRPTNVKPHGPVVPGSPTMMSLKAGGGQWSTVVKAFNKTKPTRLCSIAGVRRKISVKMCIPAKSKHLYSSDGKC